MDFLEQLNNSKISEEGPILQNLWGEYQKIIVRSLITAFGLDFLIKDYFGGDVDTVHNVKNGVSYKNAQNEKDYDNRGKYDSSALHADKRFRDYKRDIKSKMEFIDDVQRVEGTIKSSVSKEDIEQLEAFEAGLR